MSNFAWWLFSLECPHRIWLRAEKLALFFSPWQTLLPTSSNVSFNLSTFCDFSNFNFHFSPICRLISAIASLLSIVITTGSFADTISSAPALAWWSVKSFPNMSLCPGTQWTCILFPFSPICVICCFIDVTISILFVGIWFWNAKTMAPWQSVNTWIFLFSTSLTPAMNSKLICIPTNSPVKLLLYGLTPFFKSTGAASYPSKYTTPPAPVGPGFPKADPSVNTTTSSGCSFEGRFQIQVIKDFCDLCL